MHEIVTIQIGAQSNYVGTHFWNAQESYFTYAGQEESPVDHNVHFREGIGADGSDTFTPRALIYDFKNAFGSLKRINELYEEFADHQSLANTWGGAIITRQQPTVGSNAYQRSLAEGLDPLEINKTDVRFWSDFNRVYYHPRSIIQVYETELNPGQISFNDWFSGEELFASLGREEDLLDRDVRPFVEECDQMQGIQIFTDISNAWAGFTSKYLDRIRDEFGKLSVWVSGFDEASEQSRSLRAMKTVNHARALYELSNQSSIYIPVTATPQRMPSYVSWDQTHPWHVSALQAAGLESALLSTRMTASNKWDTTTLDHLAILLSREHDHRIAQLSFNVGETTAALQHTNGSSLNGAANEHSAWNQSVCQLFQGQDLERAGRNQMSHCFAELEQDRGDWTEATGPGDDADITGYRRRFLKLWAPSPMHLPASFPRIFSTEDRLAKNVPIQACLTVSSLIGAWSKSLEQSTRTRIPFDEREELSNGLKMIAEEYAWDAEGSDDEYNSDE